MKPLLAILRNIRILLGSECNKQRRFVVLVCIVAIAPNSFATTIVALRHGNAIWIAADSMQVGSDDLGNRAVRYQCKLTKEGTFYWGASANVYIDDISGFSIPKLVHQVEGKNLYEIAAKIASSAKIPISNEVLSLQKHDPSSFGGLKPVDTFRFAKVVFLGVENRKPQIFFVTFMVHLNNEQFTVSSVGPETLPKGSDSGGAGVIDDALAYIAAHQEQISSDPVGVLRNSVLAEEKAFPANIGGKTSIIQLSPNGIKWVENGECQE
jgi:hypothetical protein